MGQSVANRCRDRVQFSRCCRMSRILILLAFAAVSQAAIAPAGEYEGAEEGVAFTEEDKLKLVQELEDEELTKEIETLVRNLDDYQLEQLEAILAKDLDAASELDMLMAELEELGMEKEDVEDLLGLAEMMAKFLRKVPEVERSMEEDSEYSLDDNVKMYLLGLPNNLGPLGFFALHSVLQDEDDIVDVKITDFEPAPEAAAATKTVEPVGDVIARKKRAKEEAAAAATASAAAPQPQAQYKAEDDIVAKIMERRRRAILEN